MMKLSFESDVEMPYIERALYVITEGCSVHLGDIHYDKSQGIVEIYLQRNEIKEYKRSFCLWGGVKRVYGDSKVKLLVTINQVENVDFEIDDRLVTQLNSTFTVYFGVTLSKNEIWIESREESRGKNLCRIIIRVRKLDIDYVEPIVEI